MTIEIKELYIRVAVSTLPGSPAGGERGSPAPGNAAGEDEQEALVAACVEQLMQVLRDKMER